jgi:hypothetical protein
VTSKSRTVTAYLMKIGQLLPKVKGETACQCGKFTSFMSSNDGSSVKKSMYKSNAKTLQNSEKGRSF